MLPLLSQRCEGRGVDRCAVPLQPSGGGHVTASEQGPWQVDRGRHPVEQSRGRINVAGAVREQLGALLFAPGRATHRNLAPGIFLCRRDAVETVIGQGAEQAAPGRRLAAVGGNAKLCEQVDDVARERPAEREVRPHFGRGVETYVESPAVDAKWRRRCKLAVDPTNDTPGPQLARNNTSRDLTLAGWSVVLAVYDPNLSILVEPLTVGRKAASRVGAQDCRRPGRGRRRPASSSLQGRGQAATRARRPG